MHRLFDEASFAGAFRAGDSRRFGIDLKIDRASILAAAVEVASKPQPLYGPLSTTSIKGRTCFAISEYSQTLMLRITSRYLLRRFRISTTNRDRIVKDVVEVLGESTPMYIVRRDISSFYESLPIDKVRDRLTHGVPLPPPIRSQLACYFSTFCPSGSVGIPRGVSLSPILAELAMEDFDESIRSLPGVHRYFRYSDDILIFAHQDPGDIVIAAGKLLPEGMKFNAAKSSVCALVTKAKATAIQRSFEYLGYRYSFSDLCGSADRRQVDVRISEKKIAKYKTRIICAIKAYKKDNNYYLLLDRIKFLSGNFVVYRKGVNAIRTSKFVKSGIYHNYKLCGRYAKDGISDYDGKELKHLDGFYRSIIRRQVASTVNVSQLHQLLSISFCAGYKHKLTFSFDAQRIQQMKGVWRNA